MEPIELMELKIRIEKLESIILRLELDVRNSEFKIYELTKNLEESRVGPRKQLDI